MVGKDSTIAHCKTTVGTYCILYRDVAMEKERETMKNSCKLECPFVIHKSNSKEIDEGILELLPPKWKVN